MKRYDGVGIVGWGVGYAASRTAVGGGLKMVVIEGGAEVGAVCILKSCMPSEKLIESAN